MSWKDQLRNASFRGVEFYVDSHSKSFGRNVTIHTFPGRDTPYSEDKGRLPFGESLSCYLVGEDYIEERDALIEALNKEGPGDLIHPYFGKLFVQAGECSISESASEGGYCTISVSFSEAGEIIYPESSRDKYSILGSAASRALADSKSEFDEYYSIAGAPGAVVDAARSGVEKASEKFSDSTKFISKTADIAAELSYSVSNLKSDVDNLMQAPSKLSEKLQYSIGLVKNLNTDPETTRAALQGMTSFGEEVVVPANTDSRAKEKNNNDQLNNLIIRTSVIESAVLAASQAFDTLQESIKEMEGIQEIIEEQINLTELDDLFQSLSDLLAALVDIMMDLDRTEKNVLQYTPLETLPALVLAYELFDDEDQEEEIISRNNIKHPGFVPANRVLEIVSNE